MEDLSRLKEAMEIAASEFFKVGGTAGNNMTATECLACVSDFVWEFSPMYLSELVDAIMFYVRYSNDSDYSKDKVQKSFRFLMQNAETYFKYSNELSVLASAVARLKHEEKEAAK